MKRVSVIVPTYNVAGYLGQCLDSILAQTERDIEVICVDDGSTDGSSVILSEYASRDTRVRVVRMENRGAGAARNVGIEQACGDYLFFCDPDDWCEPDMLHDMAGIADRTAADVVVSEFYAESVSEFGDCKSERIRFSAHAEALPEVFSRRDDANCLFGDFHPMVWHKLFRRAFVQATGLRFQEIRRINDMYFAFCALARADRIVRLPSAYYHYRQNVRGGLQSTLQETSRDFITALSGVRDELERVNLYVPLRKAFVNAAFGVCWENLYRMSDLKQAGELFVFLRENALHSLDLAALGQMDFNDHWLYERYREFCEASDFADYAWKMTLTSRQGKLGLAKDCPFGILQGEVDAFANKIIAQVDQSVARRTEEVAQQIRQMSERLARTNGLLNDILWEVRESRRNQNRGWIKNFILGFPGIPFAVGKIKNVYRRVRRDGIGKTFSYYKAKYRFTNLITGGNVCVKDLIAGEMKRGEYRGVYVIPTIPWDVPIFQRPQQMALAMRKKGYLVIYLEYPDEESPVGTLREVLPGLFVVTVADFAVALRDVEGCIISVNSTASDLCYPDSRIVTKDFVSRNRVVYEYIDHFDEKISGDETAKLVGFYRQLTSSDWPVHYLASARNLQAELAERTGRKVMYVANGVDSQHFSVENIAKIAMQTKLPDCFTSERVKVGYFGALAPWLDYALIDDVVREHPEWDFIFIGPDYLGASRRLPSVSNCHWVGPIDYKVLPYYASKFDVAILPFQSGDLAKSTSPLKLFEYFALGKPVVVTQDMAECTAFSEVFRGAGTVGFAAGIDDALKAKDDPKFQERMRQLAEENTWDARAAALLKGLED